MSHENSHEINIVGRGDNIVDCEAVRHANRHPEQYVAHRMKFAHDNISVRLNNLIVDACPPDERPRVWLLSTQDGPLW